MTILRPQLFSTLTLYSFQQKYTEFIAIVYFYKTDARVNTNLTASKETGLENVLKDLRLKIIKCIDDLNGFL